MSREKSQAVRVSLRSVPVDRQGLARRLWEVLIIGLWTALVLFAVGGAVFA